MAPPPASVNSAAEAPALTDDTLDSELALLRAAQAALREKNDRRALTLVDEHTRRFPNGVLAEERAAARIFALCGLGRTDEGMRAGAAFLAAHPSSPEAARVRAACTRREP